MSAVAVEAAIKALMPRLEGDAAVYDSAAAELRRIDAAHPNDVYVQYLIGGAYDSCGREALAIAHYERVFALGISGLPEARRREIYVQMGSTLRNLGRYDDARVRFADGIAQYPDYRALRVFAAMNETSAGADRAAARHLYAFALLPEDGSIARFRRSLTWYIGQIVGPKEGDDA